VSSHDLGKSIAPQARRIPRDLDKVFGTTCRSTGLLAGRVYLTGTSGTLVGGDPWVPMSLTLVCDGEGEACRVG
jgi:hypothetical protein